MRHRTKCLSVVLLLAGAISIGLSGCSRLTPEAKAARYLEQGKQYMAKRDYSRALIEFKNAAKLRPKDAEIYYQAGLAYLQMHALGGALLNLKKATDLDPKHVQAQLTFSKLLASSGSKGLESEAEQRIQSLLAGSPDDPGALSALAVAEGNLGQTEDAVKHLQQALAKAPENLNAAMELASLDVANKDMSGAEAVLKKAVEQAPRSPELAVVLGRFYWWNNRLEEAKGEFRRAIQIRPMYEPAMFDLATMELATRNPQAAGQIYQQLSSLPGRKHLHALFLIRTGNYGGAIAELEPLVSAEPGNRVARSILVNALVATRRNERASQILEKAIRKNPKDVDALVEQAELYLQAGKLEEADKSLNQALQYRSDSGVAHLVLARLFAARDQKSQEQQQLGEALRFDPYLLPARLRLSELMTQGQGAQAALELVDKAPGSQTNTVAVIAARNRIFLALDRSAEARKGVDRGLQLARTPELLIEDAVLKFKDRNYAGGRASLEEALQKSPENLKALELLADSYVVEKQPDKGLERVRQAAAARPRSAALQYLLANRYLKAGKRDEARQALAAALAASPQFTPAALSLAQMDLADGKLDSARQRLSSILKSSPNNTAALFLLGNVDDLAGHQNAAVADYRKVIQADRKNVMALNNLAFLLSNPGTSTEALQYAQQAVELAPENPEVRDTLGWAYYQAGMYGDALKAFENATAKGGAPQWKYHLAMAYVKTGDRQRAAKIVSSLDQKYNKLPEAKMAERLLLESSENR